MEEDGESTKATKPPPPSAVLLIERDSLVREGLRALLSVWGFEVRSGADPSEALADPAGDMVPTVAILSTPGGDAAIGVEWIAALRLGYGGLPIILAADESRGTLGLPGCVHVGWPVKAAQLRSAVTEITTANRA